MTRRRTGWEMVLDLMLRARYELEHADADDEHAAKARLLLSDALYLAELGMEAAK